MEQRRIASAVLAVTGAVLMPLSLFFDWYHLDTGDSTFDMNGWQAFEIVDIVLVVAALVTLAGVVDSWRRPPAMPNRTFLLAGAIALTVVVVELIDKPPLLAFGGFDVSLRIGASLGLAGAGLVLVAGALQALGGSGPRQSGR